MRPDLHNERDTSVPASSISAVRTTVARVSLLPGLRVLMALYAPLLMGYAVGHVYHAIPFAVGALVTSLVDPGGSNQRRGSAMMTIAFGGAAAFALGDFLGAYPASGIVYAFAVIFGCGLFTEFGAAGIRTGSWITALALLGLASSGVDPGLVTPTGLILGGLWAMALGLGPFRQDAPMRKALARRAIHLRRSALDHLMLRTAVGRHAARMAVSAGTALALAYALDRPHVAWMAAAAIAVLDPRIPRLTQRGARLVAGTAVGAALAAAAVHFAPTGAVLLAVLALVLFAAVSVRSLEYGAYVTAFTAFSLAVGAFSGTLDLTLVGGKIADAVIGALLALAIAHLSFPETEKSRLASELARL